MYYNQSDLFAGLSHMFIKAITGMSVREDYGAGAYIFRQGDPARRFYTLLQGQIRLKTGDSGMVVHTVSHPGECFGWSALLDRETYSASAQCREPSELMYIEAERFSRMIEEDKANGFRFMKRLAGMLGNRLLQNYQMASSMCSAEAVCSYGTRQVSESVADIL